MCDICATKAQNIARLARYFREKAADTALAYYIDIMTKTATSLEKLSGYYAERCRCNDDADQGVLAVLPQSDRILSGSQAAAPWGNWNVCERWRPSSVGSPAVKAISRRGPSF